MNTQQQPIVGATYVSNLFPGYEGQVIAVIQDTVCKNSVLVRYYNHHDEILYADTVENFLLANTLKPAFKLKVGQVFTDKDITYVITDIFSNNEIAYRSSLTDYREVCIEYPNHFFNEKMILPMPVSFQIGYPYVSITNHRVFLIESYTTLIADGTKSTTAVNYRSSKNNYETLFTRTKDYFSEAIITP